VKFNIGDTVYWVESGIHYGKEVPCPMCFGKRFVTLILGDSTEQKIECGFCQHGIDRASGVAKTWEPQAIVCSGGITGISSRDGIRYEIGYRSLFEYELYDNAVIAEKVRESKHEEVVEQAQKWFIESFKTCTKKQVWSAGYHRSSIKNSERTIAWHRARLCMIDEKKHEAAKP
jgi:hypothetical protein